MIDEHAMVIKSNVLNEVRVNLNKIGAEFMTLPELKVLDIYLSRISVKNCELTRRVRISVEEFAGIMGVSASNIPNFKRSIVGLLQKVVCVRDPIMGFLFFSCLNDVFLNQTVVVGTLR